MTLEFSLLIYIVIVLLASIIVSDIYANKQISKIDFSAFEKVFLPEHKFVTGEIVVSNSSIHNSYYIVFSYEFVDGQYEYKCYLKNGFYNENAFVVFTEDQLDSLSNPDRNIIADWIS